MEDADATLQPQISQQWPAERKLEPNPHFSPPDDLSKWPQDVGEVIAGKHPKRRTLLQRA